MHAAVLDLKLQGLETVERLVVGRFVVAGALGQAAEQLDARPLRVRSRRARRLGRDCGHGAPANTETRRRLLVIVTVAPSGRVQVRLAVIVACPA